MADAESDYVPVRLSTIRQTDVLDFGVYIKLPSKYLLYIKKGDGLDEARYESLKERKVKRLFIADEDEPAYQSFLEQSLEQAKNNPDIAPEDKAAKISSYASNAIEEASREPITEKAFERTQNAAEGILEVINNDPSVLLALFKHEDADHDADLLLKSGVKAATLAMKFAQSLEIKKEQIHEIGIAALLRDIGAAKYPSLYVMPQSELTKDEFLIYRQHPNDTVKILNDKPFISEKILKLIQNHEEKISGQGFPGKLTSLSKEEQILSLISAYDRMVTFDGFTYKEALQNLKIEEVGNYDLELISKLGDLLVVENLI